MQRFRIKSIKQMFSLFFWITLLVVAMCSIFTFVLLCKNISDARMSAVNSVCYSSDRIITERIEAITSVETILRINRDVQEFLNETDRERTEMLKVNAAETIQTIVNVKGMGLGAALFCNDDENASLCCNANAEEAFLSKLYQQYKQDDGTELFMYKFGDPLYPELYICHFTPVIYHSLKTVDSYEVGTMAVFSKVNIYELKNTVMKDMVIQVKLRNNKTEESVVLVNTAEGRAEGRTLQSQRIGYTDWYIDVALFEILGLSFMSPFVVLSIALLIILLLYVLFLRKSIRVLVNNPVKKISTYLEEFILSKSGSTVLSSVEVEEFDDILTYINKLFERVTKQAHIVVKTQQKMYEKELLASEQSLYMNQLQINPHFLFNTLNTITQMCLAKGLNDVTVITQSISEIFRYSIEGDYKATIDEEVYIVLKYITIFNSRYGREFKCELDIEDELYEFEVMKMILQPLIENSFKHGGIANVEEPLIKISAYREDEYVVITVLDNGNGIPYDKLKQINHDLEVANTKKNKGIGLLNVNKRLKIYYGNQSGLEVDSKYDEYTKITIRIKDEKQR